MLAGSGGETKPHKFSESLKASHAAESLPFWEEAYRKAFPTMIAMHSHRQDGPHQRAGVDRSIILNNSKQLLIDEKVRGRNKKTGKVYQDIALEYLSDSERGKPGWVCKQLSSDYIAYAIAPLGMCYVLPVLQMQQAFSRHRDSWIGQYQRIAAINEENGHRWTTLSVGVPVPILFKAIGDCLRVTFSPMQLDDLG